MTRITPFAWRLGIACVSFITAIVVYCCARIYPPEILEPFQAVNTDLATHSAILGSAPSFFYTLALGLAIGACASSISGARLHCLIWIGLALFLELSQHSIFAESFSSWLITNLVEPIWLIFVPYWTRGVFDPLDLLATLVGGIIALTLLTHLPKENSDENIS
ncbi:MAG: hypothetical protein OEO18_12870 [Gammaproteobacteria bacterium]|nr:hypothetical protein [Gammaproteobacteria bacterium]